jgi:predicted KAP-like P-loop ATPase
MKEDENFCLALNGDWGSGKSSVLKLLHQKLSNNEEYILIKYDAWKNNFYPDPLIAILYSILDSIKEYFIYTDTLEKKAKRCKRVLTKTLKEFVSKGKDFQDIKIRLGCYILQKIVQVIKAVNSNILDDKNFEVFKSYQRLLGQAQEILNEIVSYPLYEGKQTKLIIMVDEIDRCLPSEQLKVLERLHHLFEVKNCAVIVALNQTAIEETFEKSFGGNGKEYLRKFFNYNFNIEIQWKTLLRNSLLDIINEFNNSIDENNLLQVEDVDFVCKFIESIISHINSFSSTKKKMENRLIERFISDVKKVLDTIPIDKLNYMYFYFAIIML